MSFIIETVNESSARIISILSDALLWNWSLNHREPTVKVSFRSMSPVPIFAPRYLKQRAHNAKLRGVAVLAVLKRIQPKLTKWYRYFLRHCAVVLGRK